MSCRRWAGPCIAPSQRDSPLAYMRFLCSCGHRFKKKDEKLEKLKACMDVLDDPEAVLAEADWDAMLTDVMKAIATPEPSE